MKNDENEKPPVKPITRCPSWASSSLYRQPGALKDANRAGLLGSPVVRLGECDQEVDNLALGPEIESDVNLDVSADWDVLIGVICERVVEVSVLMYVVLPSRRYQARNSNTLRMVLLCLALIYASLIGECSKGVKLDFK